MELEQSAIYSALGLEAPAPATEEPATSTAAVPEGTPADSAGADPETSTSAGEPEEANTGAAEKEKAEPGKPAGADDDAKAERARQAQARRAREREQAVQQATAEQQKTFNELLSRAGIMNRVNGKQEKIETVEALREFLDARDSQKLQKDLSSGKLTPEAIEQVVAKSQVVQQMQQLVQTTQQTALEAKQARDRALISDELKRIQAMDPEIGGLEDILALDTADEFQRLVRDEHMSFERAFKLANFDRLTEKKASAAKQAALNLANSKDHLSASSARGTGGVEVPAEVLREYRFMMPDATDQEIRDAYAKYLKQTKRA